MCGVAHLVPELDGKSDRILVKVVATGGTVGRRGGNWSRKMGMFIWDGVVERKSPGGEGGKVSGAGRAYR
jgi:hypothetical protein